MINESDPEFAEFAIATLNMLNRAVETREFDVQRFLAVVEPDVWVVAVVEFGLGQQQVWPTLARALILAVEEDRKQILGSVLTLDVTKPPSPGQLSQLDQFTAHLAASERESDRRLAALMQAELRKSPGEQ